MTEGSQALSNQQGARLDVAGLKMPWALRDTRRLEVWTWLRERWWVYQLRSVKDGAVRLQENKTSPEMIQ